LSCDHGIFVKQLEMSSTNLSLYKRLNFQATLFWSGGLTSVAYKLTFIFHLRDTNKLFLQFISLSFCLNLHSFIHSFLSLVVQKNTILHTSRQRFKSRSVTVKKAVTKRFWCLPYLSFFTVFIWWKKITPKCQYGRDKTPIQLQRDAIRPRQNTNR
jgi:hypothetical protein